MLCVLLAVAEGSDAIVVLNAMSVFAAISLLDLLSLSHAHMAAILGYFRSFLGPIIGENRVEWWASSGYNNYGKLELQQQKIIFLSHTVNFNEH